MSLALLALEGLSTLAYNLLIEMTRWSGKAYLAEGSHDTNTLLRDLSATWGETEFARDELLEVGLATLRPTGSGHYCWLMISHDGLRALREQSLRAVQEEASA